MCSTTRQVHRADCQKRRLQSGRRLGSLSLPVDRLDVVSHITWLRLGCIYPIPLPNSNPSSAPRCSQIAEHQMTYWVAPRHHRHFRRLVQSQEVFEEQGSKSTWPSQPSCKSSYCQQILCVSKQLTHHVAKFTNSIGRPRRRQNVSSVDALQNSQILGAIRKLV